MRLKLFPTKNYASLPDEPNSSSSSGYVPLPPQPDLERRRGASTASTGSSGSARSKDSMSSSSSFRAGSTFRSGASSPASATPSSGTVAYNPFLPPPPAPAIDITIPTKAETCAAEGHVLRRGFLSHECRRCGARVRR